MRARPSVPVPAIHEAPLDTDTPSHAPGAHIALSGLRPETCRSNCLGIAPSTLPAMLQAPSRASTASSSSFQPLSRQNTMSSYDGSRSARQSKRFSMSALYMSISATESDLIIDDDLAKGAYSLC